MELLVTIAIIIALVAVLLPALAHTMGAARAFSCQMSLRSVAFDFGVFADDELHGNRGDDTDTLGERRFYLETFQESQYGIDEFWRWDGTDRYTLPDAASNDPMRCPLVRGEVVLRRNTPCTDNAVMPYENVSYTFNKRLHRPVVYSDTGQPRTPKVSLSSGVCDLAMVPLAWDVDGAAAKDKGMRPYFSAPALDDPGPYADDRSWFPAIRHGGRANFAFVGGQVLSSRRAEDEAAWLWAYQPQK